MCQTSKTALCNSCSSIRVAQGHWQAVPAAGPHMYLTAVATGLVVCQRMDVRQDRWAHSCHRLQEGVLFI